MYPQSKKENNVEFVRNSTGSRMMFYCQAAVNKHPSRRSGPWTKWIIQFCTYSHFKMLSKLCCIYRYSELHLSPTFCCYLRKCCSGRGAFLNHKCFDSSFLLTVCHALRAHLHIPLHLMRQSWTCKGNHLLDRWHHTILDLISSDSTPWPHPVKLHWLCNPPLVWHLWAAHDPTVFPRLLCW